MLSQSCSTSRTAVQSRRSKTVTYGRGKLCYWTTGPVASSPVQNRPVFWTLCSLVRHVPKLEVYALGCSNLSFVQRCFSSTSSEFERAVIAKNLAEAAAAEALAAKLKNDAEKSKADAEKSKAETAAIHDKSKAETAAIHDKSKADAEKSKADAEKSKVETAAIHDKSKAETAAIHDKSKADVEKSKAETAAIHDKSKFDAAKSKYFLLFFKGFVILIASVRCLLHFAFVIVSISHAEIFVFS